MDKKSTLRSVKEHIKKHHKKYLLGGFGVYGLIKTFIFFFGLLMGINGLGVSAQGTHNNTTCQVFTDDDYYYDIECLDICWDNENFLDETFWSRWNNLTDQQAKNNAIICALYGSGDNDSTAYTKGWKTYQNLNDSCKGITVVYTGDQLPHDLTQHTIYVIENTGLLYQGFEGIRMNKCNAIISQSGTTILVPRGSKKKQAIEIYGKYDILDNLSLQGGSGNGILGHGIIQTDQESTVHGINIYNCDWGINIHGGYFFANNIKVYNNSVGIATTQEYSSINNAQIFNNSRGIYYDIKSSNNLFNNLSIYNNDYGIYFGTTANGYMPYINNIKIYNNTLGVSGYIDTLNVYGKSNYTGDNDYSIPLGMQNQNGLLESGEIYSMETTWDYITNVKTGAGNSGYFLDRKSSIQDLRGPKNLAEVYGYSYGSGIALQTKPLILINSGGATIENWGSYKGKRYIGSYVKAITGSLEYPQYSNTYTTVTGHSSDVANYSIFGDVVSYLVDKEINTSTNIELENSGENIVITQLLSGAHSKNFMDRYGSNFEDGQYFATHFQSTVRKDTTPPTCTITQGACTSGTLLLTLTGNEAITGGTLNTWTYVSDTIYTDLVTSNSDVNVTVYDLAGNSGSCSITTTNYDNQAPITTISSITHNWNCTSGNVTVSFQTNTNGCDSTNTTYYCTGANTCTPSIVGSSVTFSASAGQIKTGYVRYRSIDGLGNGETPKSTGLIYIDRVGPNAPTGLISTCNNGSCTFNWSEVTEDNGCSNVSGYVVQIYSGDSCGTDGKTAGSLQNPGGGSIEGYKSEGTLSSGSIRTNGAGYTTGGFEDGQTYSWRVRTLDALGNPGAWSDCQSGTIAPRELNCLDLTLWDNDNFLNSLFWNNYSGNTEVGRDQVKCALYGGSGGDLTAYTKGWSGWTWGGQPGALGSTGGCDVLNMNVIETGVLPNSLTQNTIYVLTTGEVINSSNIDMASCSAIVSKSGTILYTNATKTYGIYSYQKQYSILDNIAVDGENNGNEGVHTGNDNGIFLRSSNNNTLNNVQSYNNKTKGINIRQSSNNNSLNNIQCYNNGNDGIFLDSSNNNKLTNIQCYNNKEVGIYLTNSSTTSYITLYNTLNNIQCYNNGEIGIEVEKSKYNNLNNIQNYNNGGNGIIFITSSYNTLNNIQSYNNGGRGIRIHQSSNNNSLNNVQIYNNNYGIYLYNSNNNKYYGELNVFGNNDENTIPTGLSSGGMINQVGRSSGTFIDTGTLSWDLFTNPLDASGNYLLNWTETGFNNLRGTGLLGKVVAYSYGTGTKTQAQPVAWSGNDFANIGNYNNENYIGSNLKKEEMGIEVDGNSVTITPTNGNIDKYSIYGLTTGPTHDDAGTSTQIPGEPDYIIGQIYSDDGGYFAEHAQIVMASNSRLYCLDGWDNDNFLDEEFWNGTGNYAGWNSLTDSGQRNQAIICALYGSGKYDSTAYTKGWSERRGWQNSCGTEAISVVYTSSPLPHTLTQNTIYVIENTGLLDNSMAGGIIMKKCNAIISQTGTIILMDVTDKFIHMSDQSDILDKLSLQNVRNTSGGKGYGIYQGSKNSTINGINIYNFSTGIYLEGGYFFANNIKVYNNNTVGIATDKGYDSSINNAQIFNNSIGLYYNTSSRNYLFSNLSVYNNNIGILFGPSCNNNFQPHVNNIRLYNNIWGVTGYISTLNVYGKFNYTGDNNYSMPLGVYNQNGLLETGEIKSMETTWDYITNVKTGAGNSGYFLNWKTGINYLIGTGALRNVYGYSYGSGITLQKQPLILIISGGVTFENWGSYKGNRYIGSYIDKIEGSLEVPNTIYASGITVTGHSEDVLHYSIFGDVVSYSVNNTIHTSTNIELENTGGNIITQLLSGAHSKNFMDRYGSNFEDGQYYATHFQEIYSLIEPTEPSCSILVQEICTSGAIIVTLSGNSNDITGYTWDINDDWIYGWTGQTSTGMTGNRIVTGRVYSIHGLTGTCTGEITGYDNTAPTVTGGIFTGYECNTITGQVDASDTLCGSGILTYNRSGLNRTGSQTGLYSDIVTSGTYTVYVTDSAGNQSHSGVTFEWIDNPLTGNRLTGLGIIDDNGYPINSWTGLFNAEAGSCESIIATGEITCSSGFSWSGSINSGMIIPDDDNTTYNSGVCTGYITDGDTTQTGVVTFTYDTAEPSCSISIESGCHMTGITLTMTFTYTDSYKTGQSYNRIDTGGYTFYSRTVYSTGTYTGYVKHGNRTGFCTGIVTENNLDQLSPTFNNTPNTFTGYECEGIYGYVSATDSGCASDTLIYSRSGNYVWNPNNTIFQSGENMIGFHYTGGNRTGTNVTGTLNVYVSDSLGNFGNSTQVNFVWLDTGVTLATGQITIPVITGDNQYTTGNVIDIFGAIEGACLSGNISVYSVSCSGSAASIFTGAGNTITITGANNYSGEVVCNVVFTDDDGRYATGEIIVPIETKSLYCLDFWNNDNFLTGSFWSGWSESTGEYRRQALICALYGSGTNDPTAYTTGWYNWNWGNTTSGCNVLAMGVIETSTLPTTLDENTVYVLTGNQTATGITLNRCTAIVTSGGYTISSGRIQITGNYSIIDSLFVNGKKQGNLGIDISTDNITMNFVKVYNFGGPGINNIGDYVIMNNAQLFNNDFGLSNNGILSINNSQIYNNRKTGLEIYGSDKFLINNSYIYNNKQMGLSTSTDGLLNDVMVFNNGIGIELNSNPTVTGYGSLEYFWNGDNGLVLNSIGHGTHPFAGWSGLDINTGNTVTYNLMTMPMFTGGDDSNYLYNWSFDDDWANIRGISNYTGNVDHFSYGIHITGYAQAVALKGDDIAKPGLEIPNRYIGSQMPRATFEVQTSGSNNTYDILATGATSNVVTGYTINGGNLTGSHYTGINQWLYSISFTGSSPFRFVTIISPVYSEE